MRGRIFTGMALIASVAVLWAGSAQAVTTNRGWLPIVKRWPQWKLDEMRSREITAKLPPNSNYIPLRRDRPLYALTQARCGTPSMHGSYWCEVEARCEQDSLSPAEAVERALWLVRCKAPFIAAEVSRKEQAPVTEEQAVMDFMTDFGFYRRDNQWVAGDPESGKRQRYPLIAPDDLRQVWVGPKDRNASCESPTIPADFHWKSACWSSCYKPAMRLLFAEGEIPIEEALRTGVRNIRVLGENSTLEHPTLQTLPIENYTASAVPVWHDIVILETASGGRLELTENHPLLDGSGRMREAVTFALGDTLIRANGQLDVITDIMHERWFGRVYNVTPQGGDTWLNQVVVAEGFLSGSAWFQNDGASVRGQILMRSSIPDAALK